MTRKEQVEIYKKFEQKKEKDILMNKDVELPFGNSTVYLKCLTWRKSTEFEEELKRIILKFKDFVNLNTENLEEILLEVFALLNDDLIVLGNKATNGYITMEKIDKFGASKNDVSRIVIESMNLNYSYVKNLIAQFRKK